MGNGIEERRQNLLEEISVLEKQISYINSLENIELTEEKRKDYEGWKDFIKENGNHSYNINTYLNFGREINLVLKKMDLEYFECEEKGHVSSGITMMQGSHPSKVKDICKRCEYMYDKRITSEEFADWRKKLEAPYGPINGSW
jgi:hypothetical protein